MTALGLRISFRPPHRAIAIYRYHDEAYERQHERHIHRRHSHHLVHVNYACLHCRHHAASEDCHYQTGRSELGIVAESFEGDAIDSREHQRHTCADCNETVYSPHVLQHYHSRNEASAHDGKYHKQLSGIEIAQQEGTHEPRTAEDHHRHRQCLQALLLSE